MIGREPKETLLDELNDLHQKSWYQPGDNAVLSAAADHWIKRAQTAIKQAAEKIAAMESENDPLQPIKEKMQTIRDEINSCIENMISQQLTYNSNTNEAESDDA